MSLRDDGAPSTRSQTVSTQNTPMDNLTAAEMLRFQGHNHSNRSVSELSLFSKLKRCKSVANLRGDCLLGCCAV
jgi:hypothetical protein